MRLNGFRASLAAFSRFTGSSCFLSNLPCFTFRSVPMVSDNCPRLVRNGVNRLDFQTLASE